MCKKMHIKSLFNGFGDDMLEYVSLKINLNIASSNGS